jgi:hypothetical protein
MPDKHCQLNLRNENPISVTTGSSTASIKRLILPEDCVESSGERYRSVHSGHTSYNIFSNAFSTKFWKGQQESK